VLHGIILSRAAGCLQVDMMDIMAEFVDVSTAALTATIIPRLKAEGLLAELPGQQDTCACMLHLCHLPYQHTSYQRNGLCETAALQ
jgi:hypothetical protein